MRELQIHRFDELVQMQQAAKHAIENQLRLAIAEREGALISLAGGKTPQAIYRALAATPLEWSAVMAIPGDERWVPHHHELSNVRMLRDCFLGNQLIIESLLPDHDAELPTQVSAHHATRVLAACPQDFDLVLLGMGTDGHFASLFPSAPATAFQPERLESAVALTPDPLPPEAPYARISLTLARLIRSRSVYLCITGSQKLDLLTSSAQRKQRLPIDRLLDALQARSKQLHVYWSP